MSHVKFTPAVETIMDAIVVSGQVDAIHFLLNRISILDHMVEERDETIAHQNEAISVGANTIRSYQEHDVFLESKIANLEAQLANFTASAKDGDGLSPEQFTEIPDHNHNELMEKLNKHYSGSVSLFDIPEVED